MTKMLERKLSNPSNKKPNQAKAVALSPIDALFAKYSENYQTQSQKIIHWACSLLIVFSLLGLAWSIPFPYLKFLGQYNGFFNWASFLIAAAVYYYYKTLPGLSYIVFIELFAVSYGVMQLDALQKAGGQPLWAISLIVFIASAILQSANLKLKNEKPTIGHWLKFMVISPLWLWHFVFKKKA